MNDKITDSRKAPRRKRRHGEKGAGRSKRQTGKAEIPQPQDQAKPIDDKTRDQLISDLAKIDDPFVGDVERNKAAKLLGVRLSVIDRAVSKKRRALGLDTDDDEGQGRAVKIIDPLPWHEPISGDFIATTLACVVKTHLVLPDAAADAIALWVLHTWLADRFTMSPRLAITSATNGCGKTTVLRLLEQITRRGKRAGSISPAALFRAVEMFHPTIMLDETEKFVERGSDLHALLNEGHCKGAATWRVLGEKNELREFDVFGAVAFARNGRIPEDLAQRSIIIEMQRRLAGEPLTPLREGHPNDQLHTVARMCARWAEDHAEEVSDATVDTDTGDAINRIGDNWLPLFAIADVIGDDWPDRIREAAAALTPRESDALGTTLLADIKTIYDEKQTDRMASEELCQMLVEIEGRPWAEWKGGKPLTKNQLARVLKPFHVVPDTVRVGTKTPKGYYRHQFADVWTRYLPPIGLDEPQQRNNATAAATSTPFRNATDDPDVAFQKREKPASDGACCGVSDEKGVGPPNDERDATEDRSCRQCGGTLDGTEATYTIHGERLWLHPECKPHYLASR